MTHRATTLALALALAGCDLAHLEQKRFCARATPEECRSRPDWCFALGGPSCVGPAWVATYCEPHAASRSCVRSSRSSSGCPRDARFVDRGVLLLSSHPWKQARLTPETRALAGEKLTVDHVAQLAAGDRRELCGALPDEPCELTWGAQGAQCQLLAEPCADARYREEPVRCHAKNLCSGVICP